MNAFDKVLAEIKDDAERGQMTALATKYPSLKLAVTPDEVETVRTEADKSAKGLTGWSGWYSNHFKKPDGTAMSFAEVDAYLTEQRETATKLAAETRARGEAERLKTELEAKLAAVQIGEGGDPVKAAELIEKVGQVALQKIRGEMGTVVTMDQVRAAAKEAAELAAAALKPSIDVTGPIVLDIGDAQRRYERDFPGKTLDREKLLDFCKGQRLGVKQGYEAFTSAEYLAKSTAESETRIKTEVDKQVAAQILAFQTKANNPETQFGNAIGGLEHSLTKDIAIDKPLPDTYQFGEGAFGARVGQQWLKDQAEGKSLPV